MSEKHRRYFLKEKDSKNLLDKSSQKFRVNLEQIFKEKTNIEVIETEHGDICLIDGKPVFVRTQVDVYPTLVFSELFNMMPKVTVDMGAVPFVCKGANIMAPGIKRFSGDFKKGDFVFIIDERHGKPLALGEIVYDAEEVKSVKQGIVVKNKHYVGDNIWNIIKELRAPSN